MKRGREREMHGKGGRKVEEMVASRADVDCDDVLARTFTRTHPHTNSHTHARTNSPTSNTYTQARASARAHACAHAHVGRDSHEIVI